LDHSFGAYAKPLGLYYGVCAFIYFVVFLVCTLLAGGKLGLKIFWTNNITPALTALGTSSIATIPANLEAAEKCKYPHILET
jgi:Na+/H+-dicarboxylate symporter